MSTQNSYSNLNGRLNRELALGCRILSHYGHDDFNQGQFSIRSNKKFFHIKSSIKGFNDVTPNDVEICATHEADKLPRLAPPETPLHQAIYNFRPDVGAIVHSHAEYSLLFGAIYMDIEPISHEGAYFTNRIARYDESSHTILDYLHGQQVAAALGDKTVLFLCNHGLVVVGKTAKQAIVLSIMIERACKLQLMAKSTGISYRLSKQSEIEIKSEYIFSDIAIRNYWRNAKSSTTHADPKIETWDI